MFVVLNQGDHSEAHIASGLSGKRLFVKAEPAQYAEGWAVVTKINDPHDAKGIQEALSAGLLVASNTCAANESDETCVEDRAEALDHGCTTLHDDFPAPVTGRIYWLELPGGRAAICNPVTAGVGCDDALDR